MSGIRWLAGEPQLCAALDRAWRDPASAGAERTVLRDRSERRRLLRIRLEQGPDLFVKQFYMGGRRHRLRKRLVRLLRIEAARREWRALSRLHHLAVPVPTPRALGILPGGDRILAMDHLEGSALRAALEEAPGLPATEEPPVDRRRLARQLGRLVAALHRHGIVHRDLHAGNVLLAPHGPLLVDLQLARRGRSRRARLRDVGDLECSLERLLPRTTRVRFRAEALGVARPFDAAARVLLREAGEAAGERASAHAESRRRRALRPGRRFERAGHGGARGLRVADFPADALEQALLAHHEGKGETLGDDARTRVSAVSVDGRKLVVKEIRPEGIGERLRARWTGSAARRAWCAGFALEAHGIGAPRPLAFLERHGSLLPDACLLVLEDLRPARRLSELGADSRDGLALALARLVRELADHRVFHRDLSTDRVWWNGDRNAPGLRLTGLEHLRFGVPVTADERDQMRVGLESDRSD